MSISFSGWLDRLENLVFEGRAYIDGSYIDSIHGCTFECVSPINSKIIAHVSSCQDFDINYAVATAKNSFSAGVWSDITPAKRKTVLIRFAELIEQHSEELALLETIDVGKPIKNSLEVDVLGASSALRWSGEAVDKIYGEIAPTAKDQLGLISREPIGVVGIIVPWNFSLAMACWKLGPALAAGNSVVLKPSERSPLTCIKLGALALEAGIPKGVFNVTPGLGYIAGKALALHMDVDCIAFTGSTAVAKQLMQFSGQSNLKKIWAEAGGKSPNIIFSDAPDLDEAARVAVRSIAFNQGQVCTAGSRLLVQNSIKEKFLELLISEVSTWKVGHPLDPHTRLGALVDLEHLERVKSYVSLGIKEGGELVYGGNCGLQGVGDCYMEPVIIDQVKNEMKFSQEEIFGPVLALIGFETEEDAVRIANDTDYGLAAALWTADFSRAHRLSPKLRAGTVWINQYGNGDMTLPFGGFKQSGNGRDRSLHAFDKYTELKSTIIKI
ncbi:aldehyde dehydrogenase [Halomonas halocynthiae]|uniref:aldehyde dehydrogenase n=1 Tax=Halomonas halocynthiae TaxID=176290 RepID=UPI0003F89CB8|nr:aldehyde dehydrogenase [Halomonas halocynthiae]